MNLVGAKQPEMGARPPNPRDFTLCRRDSWTARASWPRSGGIPAPESALGLRPRRALSSAQVRSVYQGRRLKKNLAVYTDHLTHPPGLLEASYEECLCRELSQRCIPFTRQVAVPLVYKGVRLEGSLRLDMLVADLVIVEIKAVEAVLPVHQAQLLTYLKHSDLWLGLLINFNVPILKVGLTRMLNG